MGRKQREGKRYQQEEFVGQSSTGATHAFLVQFPYIQSSATLHLEPISPVVALCSNDREDGTLMHLVLESPMIPNADGVRGSEVDGEKG